MSSIKNKIIRKLKRNKYLRKIKRLFNILTDKYVSYLDLPVDDKLALVEGGQGTNINGNMFSMLNQLCTNERWSDYKVVFVVTKDNYNSAVKRMKFYGFDNVIISVRDTNKYRKYLATAKYLMTDNSFPPYFIKREEQVYLNTWHGTPLKTLGKSDLSNNASLANIQKNYFMSDYALFPNEFTRDVFMKDYDLWPVIKSNIIVTAYPRNYIFYDKNQPAVMKEKLGLKDKKVFAYMPTWRGTGRRANTTRQINITNELLCEIDEKLDDDHVLLVNLHFLLSQDIDTSKFKHIMSFPTEYDTYEVLNACDGLITDYSSVFFDYAITGKKIILFAYDKDEYFAKRGVYIPFEDLPFPVCEDTASLIEELDKPFEPYDSFIKEYCPHGGIDSCERIFELMVTGESDTITQQKQKNTDKKICVIFAGALSKSHYLNIQNYIEENPDFHYIIVYRKDLRKYKKEFLYETFGENVTSIGTLNVFQFTLKEFIQYRIWKRNGNVSEVLDNFYKREAHRLLYNINPDRVVDFVCSSPVFSGVLENLTGEKFFINHGKSIAFSEKALKRISFVKDFERKNGFTPIEYGEIEDAIFAATENEEHYADPSFRRNTHMKNIVPLYYTSGGNLVCFSYFGLTTPVETRLSDLWLTIDEKEFPIKFFANKSRLSKNHRGFYTFRVPVSETSDMITTNKVLINYKNDDGYIVIKQPTYFSRKRRRFMNLKSPFAFDKETNTVAVFRQSKRNFLNIYVRSINESDKLSKRFLQLVAYCCAKLWHTKKSKSIILLFEKNSAKYEESASVLYENLLDRNYNNAYFILTKDAIEDVPEKYRNNLLIKNTFRHYLYYFKTKTFIGTESLVHSIDLKTLNSIPLYKIRCDKNINYVFLQHGVMYMVSLNSEARTMFKRRNLNGLYRVVVSSKLEAEHFTTLGRHLPEDLYITGLPKYDRNILNPDADRITIMPTWRAWEINQARKDFTETNYYKMIVRIYESVPDELKEKVFILPHPLILNELKKIPESITNKILLDVKYDKTLRQTKLLITDYSSIAYDAFYRGANVIFYWEEKNECMEKYGKSAQLMLNEDNVYGDYFYNTEGLSEAIKKNYYNPQKEEYKQRYSKIVEFHDGKNTERLINALKKDGII